MPYAILSTNHHCDCLADVCHASVVFGHGKDYYTTEVVESTTPEWNQEASM